MMAPALLQVERDLDIENSQIVLSVTIYVRLLSELHLYSHINRSAFRIGLWVVGFAFGPLVFAPLSELFGRNIVYHMSNVLYLALTVGCTIAPNTESLLVLRLLAGVGGAPLIIDDGGTITDLIAAKESGSVMAFFVYSCGPHTWSC